MRPAEELGVIQSLEFRPFGAGDEAFVFSGILNSLYYGSPARHVIRERIFFAEHHALLEEIMRRPKAAILVASLKDDPDVAIGFALAELGDRPCLHYVYVKKPFRRYGIARALWQTLGLDLGSASYSHDTFAWRDVIRRYPGAIYNPYLA